MANPTLASYEALLKLRPNTAKSPPDVQKLLRDWDDCFGGKDGGPFLLYRHAGKAGYPLGAFYVAPLRGSQVQLTRDLLTAFVGMSYARDVAPYAGQTDPGNVARGLEEATGLPVYRLVPAKEDAGLQSLTSALRSLVQVMGARPHAYQRQQSSLPTALREFDLLLAAGELGDAEALIDAIAQQGFLTTENATWLRARVWAALGEWDTVLEEVSVTASPDCPPPSKVRTLVAKALYATHLAQLEERGDAAGALAAVQSPALAEWEWCLVGLVPTGDADATKLATLKCLAAEPASLDAAEHLLQTPALDESERGFLTAARDLVGLPAEPEPTALDRLDSARAALETGDLYGAMHLAAAATASIEKAELLLAIVDTADSLECRRLARQAMEELGADDRRELLTRADTRARWDRISDEAPPIADWREWCEWVSEGASVPAAAAVAEMGAEEWSARDLARRSSDVTAIAELMRGLTGEAQSAVVASCQHLVSFFLGDEDAPRQVFKEVYKELCDLLALNDKGLSRGELDAYSETLRLWLSLGTTESGYRDACGGVELVCGRSLGPATVDCVLNTIDSLLQFPCPSVSAGQARAEAATRVLSECARWMESGRMTDPVTLGLARLIADELDLGGLLPEPVPAYEPPLEQSPWAYYRDKTVGIYTLTETTATHARSFLARFAPGATVKANSDHVATRALKALAKSAHVFVMVVASAKHPATWAIRDARPEGDPLLIPKGKGAGSIMRALYQHALEVLGGGAGP